jgi:hypothetical protein
MPTAPALSPLDAPRWAVVPERALRIAGVVFAGAAAVPTLALCPLVLYAFDLTPLVVWVTTASTMFFAYWVMRLSRARSGFARAAKVLGLSVAGGAMNGIAAGALSGLTTLEGEAAIALPMYGAAVGLAYGIAFGLVNVLLVAVAERTNHAPRILSAQRTQRTVANLAIAVSVALLAVVLLVGVDPERFVHAHDGMTGATRASFALMLYLPLVAMMLAGGVALASALALGVRRRWLRRVLRGEDTRYRVMPLADLPADLDLAELAVGRARTGTPPEILVRVDTADEAEGGAYRSAEHLTLLARLTR